MTFDDWKIVEKTYKKLSKGIYDRKTVPKAYKMLPEQFKVKNPDKNEYIAAIKAYVEHTIMTALQTLLPDGITGQTGNETSNGTSNTE